MRRLDALAYTLAILDSFECIRQYFDRARLAQVGLILFAVVVRAVMMFNLHK